MRSIAAGSTLNSERLGHLQGDLVLDREDVAGRPIETHRPDVRTCLCVDQLGRHAHLGTVALHAAFEQVARAELSADLLRVLAPVAERKRGGTRNDVEFREVGDLVQDRLGDAQRQDFAVL